MNQLRITLLPFSVLLLLMFCCTKKRCFESELEELKDNIASSTLKKFKSSRIDSLSISVVDSIEKDVYNFYSKNEHISNNIYLDSLQGSERYKSLYLCFSLYLYLNDKEYCDGTPKKIVEKYLSYEDSVLRNKNKLLRLKNVQNNFDKYSEGDTISFSFLYYKTFNFKKIKQPKKYYHEIEQFNREDIFKLKGELISKQKDSTDLSNSIFNIRVLYMNDSNVVYNYPDTIKIFDTIKVNLFNYGLPL